MRTTVLMVAVLLAACAENRYHWNLSHQHLAPNASKPPAADIEELTRLVSERCPRPILGVAYQWEGRRRGEVTLSRHTQVKKHWTTTVLITFTRTAVIGASLGAQVCLIP